MRCKQYADDGMGLENRPRDNSRHLQRKIAAFAGEGSEAGMKVGRLRFNGRHIAGGERDNARPFCLRGTQHRTRFFWYERHQVYRDGPEHARQS
jgi:hypothetical protein